MKLRKISSLFQTRPILGLFLMFMTVFVVHVRSPNITSGDSRWFIPVAMSILKHGDINLDEYHERIHEDKRYAIHRVDGHEYNIFPIGTSILSLPFVWAVDRVLEHTAGISFEDHLKEKRSENTERFIASIFVALATVVMFLIARDRLRDGRRALLIAFVFAFATPAWSTASRALWQHGPSMLLLAAALLSLTRARGNIRCLLWTGPLLAFAYVVRPTNSLSFLLLMGAAFLQYGRRKPFWGSVLLSLGVFAAFVALNLRVFGTIQPPYFRSTRLAFGGTFPEALAGNLISPGRGLFLFTPVFLLSFYGIFLKLRQRVFGLTDAALTGVMLSHWIVISAFPHWWAGYSIGPRFFTDIVPYFVYFLIPVVERISLVSGVRRTLLAGVSALLLGVSVYAHYRSANSWRVPDWNVNPECVDRNPSRVWDWSDIQFLRRRGRGI